MSDLIDRQAAIKALRKGKPKETEYRGSCADSRGIGKLLQYESDISAVIALPSARKKGKWIEEWEMGWSECPFCGESYLWEDFKGVGEWNYCPNCGAMMEGSANE